MALESRSNCWFLRKEENRRTRRKTLGAKARTNNKLNPHMTPGLGGERSHHCANPAPLHSGTNLFNFCSFNLIVGKLRERKKQKRNCSRLVQNHTCRKTCLLSCRVKPQLHHWSRYYGHLLLFQRNAHTGIFLYEKPVNNMANGRILKSQPGYSLYLPFKCKSTSVLSRIPLSDQLRYSLSILWYIVSSIAVCPCWQLGVFQVLVKRI